MMTSYPVACPHGASREMSHSREIPVARPETPLAQLNWPHLLWFSLIQAGVVLAPFTFCWSALVVCVILYLLAGFGVTMGYHRLLTHRSFQTSRVVEYLLSVLGLLANQGGPLQWVAVHRVHHQHSDADGDPHSPNDGVCWAHLLWWIPHVPALDEPRHYRRYVADLSRDPVHRALQRYHILVPLALAALLYALVELWGGVGLSWLVCVIFVGTALLYHATWLQRAVVNDPCFWAARACQVDAPSLPSRYPECIRAPRGPLLPVTVRRLLSCAAKKGLSCPF